MTLVPVDPSNALAVTDYLTKARDWLATAVENTGPEQIAAAKAEIATAAEATKQLGLSKEIQQDAKEMVRRAEYTLGKAVRKAQAEGAIIKRGDIGGRAIPGQKGRGTQPVSVVGPRPNLPDSSSSDFVGTGRQKRDIFSLSSLDSEEFDEVLEEAKDQGNLSRTNVVNIAREKSGKPERAKSRKPLPEFARNAGWDLRKAVERIERIAGDDRFGTNKEQVATHLRSHLTNAIEVCQTVLDRINESGEA